MPVPPEPAPLDLLAAALRADSAEAGSFLEALASKLEGAVPGLVRVERGRSGFRGARTVRSLLVDAGEERLELRETAPERLEARRARLSGGIVLKTEAVGIDEWMDALTAALARQAEQSGRTRQALERLLMQ